MTKLQAYTSLGLVLFGGFNLGIKTAMVISGKHVEPFSWFLGITFTALFCVVAVENIKKLK